MESQLFKFLTCILNDIGAFKIEDMTTGRIGVVVHTQRALTDKQCHFVRDLVLAPFALEFKTGLLCGKCDGLPAIACQCLSPMEEKCSHQSK